VPYPNTCTQHLPGLASLGSAAFDQWLLVELFHTASMGQGMVIRLSGAGVFEEYQLQSYSGPGSGNPSSLAIGGDAYWDDIRVGYGPLPAAVPAPSALALLGCAGIALARARMRARP